MKKTYYPKSISTKEMELLDAIAKLGKAVCTTEEIRRAGAVGNIKQTLSSLVRKGHLFRIERGKYALPATNEENPYLLATSIVSPSYISLMSAFYIYGFTGQVPEIIYVLNAKKSKRLGKVQLVKIRPSLMFGYQEENGYLLAEPEKAIIDSLCLQRYVPLDEMATALSSAQLDYLKLAEYAVKAGKSTVARLGFLIKKLNISAGKAAIELLSRNIGAGYVLLEPGGGKPVAYDPEWKIRINRGEYAN